MLVFGRVKVKRPRASRGVLELVCSRAVPNSGMLVSSVYVTILTSGKTRLSFNSLYAPYGLSLTQSIKVYYNLDFAPLF